MPLCGMGGGRAACGAAELPVEPSAMPSATGTPAPVPPPGQDQAREAIRFFLPGPAYVTEAARRAMTAPVVGHRSAAFREVYGRLAAGLPALFRTSRDVPFATGSATLVMEMAVLNTVPSKVLNLVSGAFSERWHAISLALGKRADRVDVPWGRPVDPDLVRRALRRVGARSSGGAGGGYDAVTVVHNETSTGVINPLAEIARVVREESGALVLADAVSSLGGARVETDAWGLDWVLAGSQKALAAPPGLVPFTVSERAEARAREVTPRGYYTDLLRYLDQHRNGGPITTPAVPVAYALDHQLRAIAHEGLEARWARHGRLRERVAEWLEATGGALGFTFAAQAGARSPTVSCLRPPPGLAAPELVGRLARAGFTVGGGYGAWKAETFRIGHMGEVRERDLDALLAAIEEAAPPEG